MNEDVKLFLENMSDKITYTYFDTDGKSIIGVCIYKIDLAQKVLEQFALGVLGMNYDQIKAIIDLSKDEVNLFHKVARLKSLKKEVALLEEEIGNK